jgi:hypothetical protein
MHPVKGLCIFQAQPGPLHRFDGESRLNDAVNDFSSVTCASGVRLDHGESAVGGHGS